MSDHRHVNWWEIDRRATEEAGALETSDIREPVGACEGCQERAEEAAAADALFRESIAPHLLARVVAAAEATPRASLLERLRAQVYVPVWAPVSAVLLCVLGFGLYRAGGDHSGSGVEADHRTKGAPYVEIFVKRGEQVSRIRGERVVLRAGDRLRVVPRGIGSRSFVLFSLMSSGRVQFLHPRDGMARPVHEGVPLPGSFILDEDPAPERLFALFPEHPISPSELRAALAKKGVRAGPLRMSRFPFEGPQHSLLIEKEGQP